MSKVYINNHPLVQHKISILRDKNTGTNEFRSLVGEIAIWAQMINPKPVICPKSVVRASADFVCLPASCRLILLKA